MADGDYSGNHDWRGAWRRGVGPKLLASRLDSTLLTALIHGYESTIEE